MKDERRRRLVGAGFTRLAGLAGGATLRPDSMEPARRELAKHHHPLARLCDIDAAALLPAGRQARLGLERRVRLDAVLAHPRHRPVRPHLADQAGGAPGRAAGEAPLLDAEHVLLAERGEVVGGRAAGDAAADHDDAGLRGKRHNDELTARRRPASRAAVAVDTAAKPSPVSPALPGRRVGPFLPAFAHRSRCTGAAPR